MLVSSSEYLTKDSMEKINIVEERDTNEKIVVMEENVVATKKMFPFTKASG